MTSSCQRCRVSVRQCRHPADVAHARTTGAPPNNETAPHRHRLPLDSGISRHHRDRDQVWARYRCFLVPSHTRADRPVYTGTPPRPKPRLPPPSSPPVNADSVSVIPRLSSENTKTRWSRTRVPAPSRSRHGNRRTPQRVIRRMTPGNSPDMRKQAEGDNEQRRKRAHRARNWHGVSASQAQVTQGASKAPEHHPAKTSREERQRGLDRGKQRTDVDRGPSRR